MAKKKTGEKPQQPQGENPVKPTSLTTTTPDTDNDVDNVSDDALPAAKSDVPAEPKHKFRYH